jgi:hypothetical protein
MSVILYCLNLIKISKTIKYIHIRNKIMFLDKQKKIELLQLESLLNALVNESYNLTESQIEDVVDIQDSIKLNNKIVLSEEAYSKYEEFIEKVMLFDDSLKENSLMTHFTGIDEGAYKELETKIINSKNKTETLKQIDDLIENSDRIMTYHSFKEFVMGGFISIPTGSIGAFVRMWIRLSNTKDRAEFKERLMDLRNKVKNSK